MKTTLLVMVLGLGACEAGSGLPEEETAAPAAAPIEAPAPPPCVAIMTDGQSAIVTPDKCYTIEAGTVLSVVNDGYHFTSTQVVKPGPQILSTWAGPHARLCAGRTADALDACASNSMPAPSVAPMPVGSLVFSSVPY